MDGSDLGKVISGSPGRSTEAETQEETRGQSEGRMSDGGGPMKRKLGLAGGIALLAGVAFAITALGASVIGWHEAILGICFSVGVASAIVLAAHLIAWSIVK